MILVSILIGLVLGTFTGVIPGIHPNLVATILTRATETTPTTIYITALVHTFISTIPAIYLFTPEPSTSLLIHPAQQYSKEGKAHEAILLTLIGSLASLLLLIPLTPLIIHGIEPLYNLIKNTIPFILLLITILLIYRQKSKGIAILTFLFAGALGYQSLNANVQQPLLPLFTGLFGIPAIITALKNKQKATQRITEPELEKEDHRTILTSSLFGSIFSFLPALGPAQAATIQSEVTKKSSAKNFLIVIGCLNTIHIIISLLTAHEISKARSGAIAIIQEFTEIKTPILITLIIASLIIAFPTTAICIFISRWFLKFMHKVNNKKILTTVLLFLLIITFIICGPIGIIILTTATFVGLIPYYSRIHRTTLMGSLMIPTMIYYLTQLFI